MTRLNKLVTTIYIDFTDNTDDLRRNAALFEAVVRWVNVQKSQAGSTEPNVVMGESMGGLIARYGLARLVRGGYNPQTRLLVLHDSPQRGAYSPMGIQALTRQADFPIAILPGNYSANSAFIRTSDLSDKLKEALAILDAPATRQLSLKSVTGINDEYQDNTFIEGPYKDMIDFSASGGPPVTFPVIVATSDGSQCGRLQGTAPHQELTRNVRSYLLNPFIVAFGFQSEAVANALPAYGTQDRLAHLRIWFTFRILWCHIDITVLNRNYNSPANTLPYETLPGGYVNLADQRSLLTNSFIFTSFNFTTVYNGPLCFVPSYSAMDVQTITPATAAVSYLYGAPAATSAVPRVAKFIAQEQVAGTFNQGHLQFTARNSQWIFNEMQGISNAPLNCQTECSPYPPVPVAGPDIICANGSATFTVVPPFGGVTDWDISPAGLAVPVTPTAGATSITLAPATSSSNGIVTLTAHLSNGCHNTTTTRQVAVGTGFLVVNDNRNDETCATPGVEFAITREAGASGTYTWYVSHGRIDSGQGTGRIRVEGLPYQDYRLTVYVSSPASCPGADPLETYFYQDYTTQLGGNFCPQFRSATSPPSTAQLYPNPARETVDVHTEGASAASPVTVRLFDGYGQPRAEQTSTGAATVRLKTDQLPAGLYFVHILRGTEVLSRQQLRIEK